MTMSLRMPAPPFFIIWTLLAGVCIQAPVFSQTNFGMLKGDLERYILFQKGSFAVAFKDLDSDIAIYINARDHFHAASTMKTPVMFEVLKMVDEAKLSLTDSVLLKNDFKSIVDASSYSLNPADDSDTGLYDHIGEKTTIYDLMYRMITVSSNLATNLLIELVTPQRIAASLKALGLTDIKVPRGVEDGKAYAAGMNSVVTAYDLAALFEALEQGKILSQASTKMAIQILSEQKFNTVIPAKLPREVRVAHKTGFISKVEHDSGIVFLPNGKKYVLVILSKDWEDREAAIEAMATISKKVYDFVK